MPAQELTPRAPRKRDVAALIGLLAALEGELMTVEGDEPPDWARRVAGRLARDRLHAPDAGGRQLRQCLNDLNHRLRYVFGEYDDEPPGSTPIP